MSDYPANALMQYVDQNDFQRLTPEQQAMIERDKINESIGPFDFMPGPMTGIYGAIGSSIPSFGARSAYKYAREYGESRLGSLAEAAREVIPGTAIVGGLSAGIGYAHDIINRIRDRDQRERLMMHGNPADAEGQPGGFYGQNALMRR